MEAGDFGGNIWPRLLDLFPDQKPIGRKNMNSWEDQKFVAAVKKAGRKNLIISALWTEVCLVFPALQAMTDGFYVYAVEDASGGTSVVAHDAAMRRMAQAGAVPLTALQVLLEYQRDWARDEHYDEVMATAKTYCNIYGLGVENDMAKLRQ